MWRRRRCGDGVAGGGEGAVEATEATEAMGAVAGGWWEGGIYGVKP